MKLVGFERNFQFFSGFEGFFAVLKMGVSGNALTKNRYAKCAAAGGRMSNYEGRITSELRMVNCGGAVEGAGVRSQDRRVFATDFHR